MDDTPEYVKAIWDDTMESWKGGSPVFRDQTFDEAMAELIKYDCGCLTHPDLDGYLIKRGDTLLWEYKDHGSVPWDERMAEGISNEKWFYIPF